MMQTLPKMFMLSILTVSFAAGGARVNAQGARPDKDEGFQLRNGDRVVFLGDSITASRAYGQIVERYTLSSYPDRKVQFFNAGQGGDTSQGALKRLDRDVLSHKPTVVTVCFGVNDIGWGMYADEQHKQAHYDGIREIITRCQKVGARVYILGPCATALAPEGSTGVEPLKEMSQKVRAMAEGMGARSIDLFDEFQTIERRVRATGREKDAKTHAPDGIHLSELGNLAFAYILLKGLGAPDVVSELEIDASDLKVTKNYRCAAKGLKKEGDSLRFTRLDEGWPLHLGGFAWINFAFVPTPENLSQYRLKVSGLKGSNWFQIKVNGQNLSTVTLSDLSKGLNLGYSTPEPFAQFPPWKTQGTVIDGLVKSRNELSMAAMFAGGAIGLDEKTTSTFIKHTETEIVNIEDLQHEIARTKPLQFEIVPAMAPEPPAKPDPEARKKMIEAIRKAKERAKAKEKTGGSSQK